MEYQTSVCLTDRSYECSVSISKIKLSPYHRQLISLAKRIKTLESKLYSEEVAIQQSTNNLSLKHLRQRVEKLERIVKTRNSKANQPSTTVCLKFLFPIAADWQNLGVFLKISDSDLKQIESDYSGRCRDCVREMIRKWLKQVNPSPSWQDLAEAVKLIDPSIAERIIKQHCY